MMRNSSASSNNMKTLTLKEAQAPYLIAIDDAPLVDEVVILEKGGQAVAAGVPILLVMGGMVGADRRNYMHRLRQSPRPDSPCPLLPVALVLGQ